MNHLLLDIKYEAYARAKIFGEVFADRKIVSWSDEKPENLEGFKYIVCWDHEHGLPAKMPDLEVVFSLGAGVDHVLSDPQLPDVPIVRFVDPSLTSRMSEWIVLQVLMHLRQQRRYDLQQSRCRWQELQQPEARELVVGIMGMGVLGQEAARKLKTLGFQVRGWSRSKKQLDGIECFSGAELDGFLSGTDILVGLLPHTKHTTGIFNRGLFEKLSRLGPFQAPVFINAGRGKSQVETDIVSCLEDGTLHGVSLDVFEEEPLAASSPLWGFSNAVLTPHMAATSDIRALASYVHEQVMRHEAGKELQNLVDPEAGY